MRFVGRERKSSEKSGRVFIFPSASAVEGMKSVPSVCVCVGLLRAHYTPLQRYMGYLCNRKAQYAPSGRNMHHGVQGRLCFLKNRFTSI